MSNQDCKLEHPDRIAELSPKKRLIEGGFQEGMTLCDLGAGTGIFSLAAAEISQENIYAIELSEERLDILAQKKLLNHLEQMIIKRGEHNGIPLPNHSCDYVVVVTVFHEIEKKIQMLHEIKRVLTKMGG